MTNSAKPNVPFSLKIVTAMFLFSGLASAAIIFLGLVQGKLIPNPGVLSLLVGLGLLQLWRGFRTAALINAVLGLVAMPLVALMIVNGSPPIDLGDTPATTNAALVFCGVFFAVYFWQYRVLTRHDVRELFETRRVSHGGEE